MFAREDGQRKGSEQRVQGGVSPQPDRDSDSTEGSRQVRALPTLPSICSRVATTNPRMSACGTSLYHQDLVKFEKALEAMVTRLGKNSPNTDTAQTLRRSVLFREAEAKGVISISHRPETVAQNIKGLSAYFDEVTKHLDYVDSPFGSGKPDAGYVRRVGELLTKLNGRSVQHKTFPVDSYGTVTITLKDESCSRVEVTSVRCSSKLVAWMTLGLIPQELTGISTRFGTYQFIKAKGLPDVAAVVLNACHSKKLTFSHGWTRDLRPLLRLK